MGDSSETRVEALCQTILKTDSENWDTKNKAVQQLIEFVKGFESRTPSAVSDAFTPAIFRLLKEPVKVLISDLRSQQVRDVCVLLTALAKVTGERMKPFMRDSFVHILEAIKVPNKVMSGYVDECIQDMIRYCTFKSGIPVIVMEIKDSKAKMVREKCLEYLNTMLCFWDMSDRDLDPICDALKLGLEDASPKARETARAVFFSMNNINSRRAERIRSELPKTVQAKLAMSEESHGLDTSVGSISFDHTLSGSMRSEAAEPARPRTHGHALASSRGAEQLHQTQGVAVMHSITPTEVSPTASELAAAAAAVPQLPSTAQPSKAPTSSMSNRRRSVVKNPFADTIENYTQAASQSSSHHSPNGHSKLSPSKFSPSGTKTAPSNSFRTSPAHTSTQSTVDHSSSLYSRSADASPRAETVHHQPVTRNIRAIPFPERAAAEPPQSPSAAVPDTSNDQSPVDSISSHKQGLSTGMRAYAYVSKDNRVAATVRFIGLAHFATGTWVGVELDSPIGKNNGTVQGTSYFTCRPNYGLFLREDNVVPFSNTTELSNRMAALTRKNSGSSASFYVPRTNSSSSLNGTPVAVPARSPISRSPSSSTSLVNLPDQPTVASPLVISVAPTPVVSDLDERRSKSSSRLKMKLSQMMSFLNQQLELVEELEREEKSNPISLKATELRREVKSLTEQELETVITFRNQWRELV